jgi:hypothetical protein
MEAALGQAKRSAADAELALEAERQQTEALRREVAALQVRGCTRLRHVYNPGSSRAPQDARLLSLAPIFSCYGDGVLL